MLFSGFLLITAMLVYYQTGDHYVGDDVLIFDRTNLGLVVGEGKGSAEEDGLIVGALGDQGFAMISSSNVRLKAEEFNQLAWQINGLADDIELQFIWITRRNPKVINYKDISHHGHNQGVLDLNDNEQWEDLIGAIGLRIQGRLSEEPLIVRELKLRTAIPGFEELFAQFWQEWAYFESWNERSINFIVGGERHGVLLRPVPAVALWIGVNCLFYAGLILIQRRSWPIMPFVAFILVGWLLIDARWQWSLWQQNKITFETFAGKNWEEKRLADSDGKLFGFIQKVRENLPSTPVRVFVAGTGSEGGQRFLKLRAHYHLLPHNSYSNLTSLSDLDSILKENKKLSNSYLLILNPFSGLKYIRENHQLISSSSGKKISIDAELLYSADEGYLFQLLDV